ncbi:serine/threonine-protein kinase [Enhygromyxa salina]|uniref:serine/threonine-protein kinase n=1 Tax=Enhygromyxa salina TaxID=215803 RepID=UPI0015E5FA3F|nr:serine/threonine-protein kinase [Enhygromyxa salina]
MVEAEARWAEGYERDEDVARSLRLRRIVLWGGLAWLSFLPIDISFNFMRGVNEGPAYVLARMLTVIPLVLVWIHLGRGPTPSRRQLMALEGLTLSLVAGVTAYIVVLSGGLASPSLAGLLPILVVRAIAIPDRWQRGLALLCMPTFAFWAVLGVATLTRADAPPLDPAIWATVILHLGLQAATIGMITIGTHAAWDVRRSLYKARTVGRYELLQPLGRGAMGEVWTAWHQTLHQQVALKILPIDHDNGAARARFEREVAATTKLRHPNTVRVYDFGLTADGFCYYVMELLEGETVAELVARDGPLPIARSLALLRQAARALAEAHGLGIVHRDVKPENLFVSTPAGERDVMKVLDFGVASVAAEAAEALDLGPTEPLSLMGRAAAAAARDRDRDPPTEPGFGERDPDGPSGAAERAVGTPLYISPEVARGGVADPRSDIYGLGCVLYFMLTGRPVFVERDVPSLLRAHAEQLPAPPSTLLASALPDYVEKLVMRCLAKDPGARYANADALVAAIDLCVRLGHNDRRRGGGESQQPRVRASRAQLEAWTEHSKTETDMTVLGAQE